MDKLHIADKIAHTQFDECMGTGSYAATDNVIFSWEDAYVVGGVNAKPAKDGNFLWSWEGLGSSPGLQITWS